jgi:hypothetical protein
VLSAELDTKTSLDIVSGLLQKDEYNAALLMHNNFISPYDIEKCTPKTQARYHFLKARCLMGLYEFEQAKGCFAMVLKIEPKNIEFLYWAARCELGLGVPASSVDILTLARSHVVFTSSSEATVKIANIALLLRRLVPQKNVHAFHYRHKTQNA